MSEQLLDPLAPLYAPWEMPNRHRGRAAAGAPAPIVASRRPSGFGLVNRLRHAVDVWREIGYYGACETSRTLLHHWFHNDHLVPGGGGEPVPFRYYWCQREAIETLIFLYESQRVRSLTDLLGEWGHEDEERRIELGLGVDPDQDRWPRYAFKIATGAGKTKVMSLAIVWSYFHALREPDSDLARHFVVIAPNLIVFERLKQDFAHGRVFYDDPLVPEAWKGDWHLTTVLQDEASGAASGATLHLTNIHRLYAPARRRREEELVPWAGPAVSRATALEVGEELRARIASHGRVMVLNDEAHHVWDPRSAWNEALDHLHGRLTHGLCCQLDFSATPKDQQGQPFQHIVVESALGEAVDGGLVKTPVIGRGKGLLVDETAADAADRYLHHLIVGYERWRKSWEEWSPAGRTPLLFVMCEDTAAADQIARRLNTDSRFELLNQRTINLHTNLKGKMVERGRGANRTVEFVESEKDISDEDLAQLRRLSQELDQPSSPYRCIVSVLMLREGWDVKNVTTIVPLRALTSQARILPEQTLGRGLRRMTPPVNGADEIVVVVEHEAFAQIVRDGLAEEGVEATVQDAEEIDRHTVTIFADRANKQVEALDITLPGLTPAHQTVVDFQPPTIEEVKQRFDGLGLEPLRLGEPQAREIVYDERTLFGEEQLRQMKIPVSLLDSALTAPSYFHRELEQALRLRGLLGQEVLLLIKRFLLEVLFGELLQAGDPRLAGRLGESDVRESVRAVFAPLLGQLTRRQVTRQLAEGTRLSSWRPYQVTSSAAQPAVPAQRTLFNLVPCNRGLERRFAEFLDRDAQDVVAFAKNAGPQALRIDYLAAGHRLAFYTPDFFVRLADGRHLLIETKGREDLDVPAKARAAVAWCQSASKPKVAGWSYLFLAEAVFERFAGSTLDALVAAAAPTLQELLELAATTQMALPFDAEDPGEAASARAEFISADELASLPKPWQESVTEAVALWHFIERRGASYAPAFTALLPRLDEGARRLITVRLQPLMPADRDAQRGWFDSDLLREVADPTLCGELDKVLKNLRKTLVFSSGIMPLGLLAFCLDYPSRPSPALEGVFAAVRDSFAPLAATDLPRLIGEIKQFRNAHVAHGDGRPIHGAEAKAAMRQWIQALARLATVT